MRLMQIFMICGVLTAIALGLFAYKAGVLDYPVLPNEEAQSWQVEAKIRFNPQANTPLRVHVFRPQGSGQLALVDENVVASGYGVTEKVGKRTGNRALELTRRTARGQQVLFYQALLYELKSGEAAQPVEAPQPAPVYVPQRPEQMANGTGTPVDAAINGLIAEAREKSADNISFAQETIKLLKSTDDRVTILQNNLPEVATLAARASMLINAADIPAQVVNGIALREGKNGGRLLQWIEVYNDGAWRGIDLERNSTEIDASYLPWWRGTRSMVDVTGGSRVTTEISIKYNREGAVAQAQWKSKHAGSFVSSLSLFDLPVDTQLMFNIVLMIPIGGLVIVALRQMIGVPTFGTFMPVLIALSFRETGLLWGVALFGIIVTVGLFLRAYFDKLRLLVVPRLASVLTIVVLLIAALTVIAFKLGINAGLSITLFPMIILTMMIERMALMTEEFGAKETRKTVFGSLFAATLAYFAMHNAVVAHLVFVFPELLLIILACTILLGRYNGYKLSEYLRFKKLAQSIAANEGK